LLHAFLVSESDLSNSLNDPTASLPGKIPTLLILSLLTDNLHKWHLTYWSTLWGSVFLSATYEWIIFSYYLHFWL